MRREKEKDKNTEWKERVKELERRWEVKERGERRRNILVKGLKDGEGRLKERVEKALEGEIKVEEVRKIEAGKTERGNMVIAKLGSEDMSWRILMIKWKLKGGRFG